MKKSLVDEWMDRLKAVLWIAYSNIKLTFNIFVCMLYPAQNSLKNLLKNLLYSILQIGPMLKPGMGLLK